MCHHSRPLDEALSDVDGLCGVCDWQAAKENWQKYGNPDGKQALEVSIGLPTFLLDKDNHAAILLVYLVILVIAIPMGA